MHFYTSNQSTEGQLNPRRPIRASGIFVMMLWFFQPGLLSLLGEGMELRFLEPLHELCERESPVCSFSFVLFSLHRVVFILLSLITGYWCIRRAFGCKSWKAQWTVVSRVENLGLGTQDYLHDVIEGPHSLVIFPHHPLSFGLLPHGHKMVTELSGTMFAF